MSLELINVIRSGLNRRLLFDLGSPLQLYELILKLDDIVDTSSITAY